jgi:DNA polymerase-3 subunit delta'
MHADEARKLMKQAFASGRLAHAYLLVGSPRGIAGEMAVFMMQMLACLQAENAPCGVCDRCRQVAEHAWCDNLWIFPVKKSRIISIDQMRKSEGSAIDPPYFLTWLGETAFAGGWKVGVLAGADRMNDAAANAFLKMLEEPPQRTLILLLTDAPQALLPTIRSRCQRIDLDELPPELEEPWRGEVLSILATGAVTGPVAAMALGDRLMKVLQSMKARAETLVEAEQEASASEAEEGNEVMEARVSARYRELRALLVLALQRWYRDLLALRAGAPASVVHYQSHLELLRKRAQRLTLAQALANVEGVETMARQLERSLTENALLAYWMDRIVDGAT